MTENGLKVAVLAGGPSSEAEVSRVSASAVARALAAAGHRTTLLELDGRLPKALSEGGYSVAFPALHGRLGEDGCVQGLLEVLDLPYVGAGVLASALAASKPDAKKLFRLAGLPVAPDVVVQAGEPLDERALELRAVLGPALVVKPAQGGSAIGVQRLRASDPLNALVAALQGALSGGDSALVEPWVQGYEVTCGVLEDGEGVPHALPLTLVVSKAADWYDFTSRYAPGGSEHQCPAPFSRELSARVQEIAVAAHRALGVRDLCRVDFVVGDQPGALAVTLLEVNTLPGMTPTSLFPEAASVAGKSFIELCDSLVRRAHTRPRPKPVVAPRMPSAPPPAKDSGGRRA
ncbi:MAG TPA: D-alanine--D-alanine ligase [Polyangiaceae bacterium]